MQVQEKKSEKQHLRVREETMEKEVVFMPRLWNQNNLSLIKGIFEFEQIIAFFEPHDAPL